MVVSTDVALPDRLLPGITPLDVVAGASEMAKTLNDVIRQQRMYTQIGSREHIQIEAWQVCSAFTGVFAVKDGGIRELPWPVLAALGEEPEDSRTAAHAAWRDHRTLLAQRDIGRAYGFSAAFRAVKDGRDVGWGEGRCSRGEKNWMTRDDYALASMAQTRGQSRTLAAPLRFIVKLAGFETTPAEELDGTTPSEPAPASPFGALVDADGDAEAARIISELYEDVSGVEFVRFVNRQYGTEHLPDAAAKMLKAIKWALGAEAVRKKAPENAPPDPDESAYHGAPPDG